MNSLHPRFPRPHQILGRIINKKCFSGIEALFFQNFLKRSYIGFAQAQLVRVVGFDEIVVKIGAVVLAGKDLCKSVVMDAVGIGEEENAVLIPDAAQPVQSFGRKIEQQGVPGGFDLVIGYATAGFAAKSLIKFPFAHLAGFQLLKQVVSVVLGKHAGELGDAEVDKSLFGKTKIEVHKNAPQVENDVFDQFENLRMREFEKADWIVVKGIQLPIYRQVMA